MSLMSSRPQYKLVMPRPAAQASQCPLWICPFEEKEGEGKREEEKTYANNLAKPSEIIPN